MERGADMYTVWEHQQHEERSRRRSQSQARKGHGQESLVQAHSGLEELSFNFAIRTM